MKEVPYSMWLLKVETRRWSLAWLLQVLAGRERGVGFIRQVGAVSGSIPWMQRGG